MKSAWFRSKSAAEDSGTELIILIHSRVIYSCRIARWFSLIRPIVEVSQGEGFRVGAIGLMFVMILRLHLGELARPFPLNRQKSVPFSSGLASIMIETIVDVRKRVYGWFKAGLTWVC